MGTGKGLQREGVQSRQFAKRPAEQRTHRLGTLDRLVGLQRVQVLELRQGSHLLVDLRVILHRTRPQGIKAIVDAKVIGRQIGIMAHHGHLVALGQFSIALSAQLLWHLVVAEAVLGQTVTFAALLRQFKNQVSIKSVVHRAAIFTRLSISSFERFSVTAKRKPRPRRTPPRKPASVKRWQSASASPS